MGIDFYRPSDLEVRELSFSDAWYSIARRETWHDDRKVEPRLYRANLDHPGTPIFPMPPEWMASGACIDTTGIDFFRDHAQARAVCAECPVQTQCRDYAIDEGIAYGIWGGCTPGERMDVAAGSGRSVARHSSGTRRGWLYAVRLGTLVKVGFTTQALTKRLNGIRQQCPLSVRIPEVVLMHRLGSSADERLLHVALAPHRAPHPRGEREWYRYSSELLIALGLDSEAVAA